jgi:hypothetical protein
MVAEAIVAEAVIAIVTKAVVVRAECAAMATVLAHATTVVAHAATVMSATAATDARGGRKRRQAQNGNGSNCNECRTDIHGEDPFAR